MSEASRLNKIRKLLALAEDPAATPAEALAFTEKAMMLMARHGIDEALLAEAPASGRVANRRMAMPSPYARDKATLASAIANASRCRAILLNTERGFVVQVFGLSADVRTVDMLFTSLLVQASHEVARSPVPPDEHAAAYRRSWWAGFTIAVHSRLEHTRRAAEARAEESRQGRHGGPSSAEPDGPSVALVLAHRADEIDDEVARMHPNVRAARGRRLSGGGRAAGYESGQRVDLGTEARIAGR
jgi:hypothetical protein